jgi:hypothetical protein
MSLLRYKAKLYVDCIPYSRIPPFFLQGSLHGATFHSFSWIFSMAMQKTHHEYIIPEFNFPHREAFVFVFGFIYFYFLLSGIDSF